MDITLYNLTTAMNNQKYKVFESGEYNLNIVGVRSLPGTPNRFDDYICCFYKVNGAWRFHKWEATTDPGTYWLQYPMRTDGTAILQPGQYRSCWQIGKHNGKYEALTQAGFGIFKVWRDRDRNGTPDYDGKTYLDVGGLNCHKSGIASTQVDKWSAGCQVLASNANFSELMSLAHKQVEHGQGSKFSYTLLTN